MMKYDSRKWFMLSILTANMYYLVNTLSTNNLSIVTTTIVLSFVSEYHFST